MPGLILFNRRWHVGDDDFVFRGILEMVFRAAWLIALAVVYVVHRDSFTCKKGLYLEIFYVGLIGLTVINIILTLCIVCISSQGTMANAYPRRWLGISLYMKLVFGFVAECILLIAGTYWAFGDTTRCDDEVVLTMKIAAVMGLVVILLFIISIAVFFDPLGGKMRSKKKKDLSELSTDVWLHRCSRICCCVGTDTSSKASLTTVARITADFFEGIDMVATDIAAGFVLVHEDQDRRGLAGDTAGYVISPSNVAVEVAGGPEATTASPSAPIEDWLDINRMIRYLKYAQAAFGWPFYLVMNGHCYAPCTLAKHYKCCAPEDENFVEDNCCQCNLAALKLTAQVEECDIIYATYHDGVPFYVAYDHKDKTVMLVSRGLLSLKDTITSLTVESEHIEFSELPDEPNEAHKGIMETAKYIKSEVDRLQLLQRAFQEHPDYTLVLTGYSLGAGLSACLALLYHSQYPSLKCYSFACPPVLTPALAEYAQSFICSVVFAKDMVPRLSRVNMDDLKLKVLRQIKQSKRPKFRILASGMWHFLCGCPKPVEDIYDPFPVTTGNEKPSSEQDSKVNLADDDSQSWVDKAIASCQKDVGAYPVLNVPGKIMRIIEVENNEYRYLLWTKHDDLREIIVTPRMLTDHLPNRMLAAFEFLVQTGQTTLDHLPQLR